MAANFDPRVSLATALGSQRGVYALLLGSGVSTGAGIRTGWGVVDSLVRKAATASGADVSDNFSATEWWEANGDGQPLGYSSLLERLASTRAARRSLLAGFFEPTDDDRDSGLKIPGPAHQAIARMVRKGLVRVIITTNFDRLLERALEAEGISPQVISSDAAIAGMEPMQHMACTIVKLHGDYASLDQRNTVDELASYPPRTKRLLARVLDEYGLIVSGWSGDWDPALVAALDSSANRRYPLYWVSRSAPAEGALRLTSRSGAQIIERMTADEFFPDMLRRVEALDSLTDAPDSVNLAIARLKRSLPDPKRHIEVRELFDAELKKLASYLQERAISAAPTEWEQVDSDIAELRARTATLLNLYITGIFLDRDRQHTDLWVEVLERAMLARGAANTGGWWGSLAHYPALLLLRAGTIAALSARREDVIVRLMGEAKWSSPTRNQGEEMPAWEVLNPDFVIDPSQACNFPRVGKGYFWPASKMVREDLQEYVSSIIGGTLYDDLHKRAEFRAALAYQFVGHSGRFNMPLAGEYIGEQQWTWGKRTDPIWGNDFKAHGDRVAWIGEMDSDTLDTQLESLYEVLRTMRRIF